MSDQLEREVTKSDAVWGVPGSRVPAVALETRRGMANEGHVAELSRQRRVAAAQTPSG